MIEERTVLVLGAGASAHLGFPVAYGVLLHTIDSIRRKEETLFYRVLRECGFSDDHMQEFARDLERSIQPSVDAFLENRPEFLDIGKAAIAASLIPYESEGSLQARRQSPYWYEYLINQLGATRAEYERSKLAVITFNYDRSLEHFLFLALKPRFKLSDEEAKRLRTQVPLVHVYGQLAALEYMSPGGRPYDTTLNADMVLKCAREIKILHEGQGDSSEFKEAHDLLRMAEVVAFLGFGYGVHNLERLRPELIPEGARVYGSSYGMTANQKDSIKPLLGKHRQTIQFGGHRHDVLAFLQNYVRF